MKDIIKDKLRVLAEDEFMLKALKAVIDDRINKMKPDIEKTDDNKILGEKYRASKEAEELLKGALEDISSYKTQRSNNKQSNKGI